MKTLTLSVEGARELDRLASEKIGIPSFVLMENAGRELAAQIEEILQKFPYNTPVAILCGSGSNGGDGYAAARHLLPRHAHTYLYSLSDPQLLKGDALLNYQIATNLGQPIFEFQSFLDRVQHSFQRRPIVVVDAMLGTGFIRPVRPRIATAIESINELKKFHNSKVTVIAVDVPSGLDGNLGFVGEPTICADVTVTFACIKKGLLETNAKAFVGRLKLVDIGIPDQVMEMACAPA